MHRRSRYDIQGKAFLKTQGKFYLSDSAFRYSVLGYTPDSVAAMLENIVYLELLRRGYDVCIGKPGNAEIDFVAPDRKTSYIFRSPSRLRKKKLSRGSTADCSV